MKRTEITFKDGVTNEEAEQFTEDFNRLVEKVVMTEHESCQKRSGK